MSFQPVDTPDHCGMIDAQLFCGSGYRSAARDGQQKSEVIPVDRTAALIQHFRTSMVHFIGLVSQEMQVKKVCKATNRASQGENSCVPSDISSAAKKFRARQAAQPTF